VGKEGSQSVRADPRYGNAIEVYGQEICDKRKIVIMELDLNRVCVLAHKQNFCELFITFMKNYSCVTCVLIGFQKFLLFGKQCFPAVMNQKVEFMFCLKL
jgi:hypothetical protein